MTFYFYSRIKKKKIYYIQKISTLFFSKLVKQQQYVQKTTQPESQNVRHHLHCDCGYHRAQRSAMASRCVVALVVLGFPLMMHDHVGDPLHGQQWVRRFHWSLRLLMLRLRPLVLQRPQRRSLVVGPIFLRLPRIVVVVGCCYYELMKDQVFSCVTDISEEKNRETIFRSSCMLGKK